MSDFNNKHITRITKERSIRLNIINNLKSTFVKSYFLLLTNFDIYIPNNYPPLQKSICPQMGIICLILKVYVILKVHSN